MKIEATAPAFPQSLSLDSCGDLRASDEPGYCRSGMDLRTLASLEFAKIHLAAILADKTINEPFVDRMTEACLRGWEMAKIWADTSEFR